MRRVFQMTLVMLLGFIFVGAALHGISHSQINPPFPPPEDEELPDECPALQFDENGVPVGFSQFPSGRSDTFTGATTEFVPDDDDPNKIKQILRPCIDANGKAITETIVVSTNPLVTRVQPVLCSEDLTRQVTRTIDVDGVVMNCREDDNGGGGGGGDGGGGGGGGTGGGGGATGGNASQG